MDIWLIYIVLLIDDEIKRNYAHFFNMYFLLI